MKKKHVFSVFSLFFVGKQHRQKIRVLAFITRSALCFFFVYQSAEGDDEDELSVFELLLLLFLLKEVREKKKLVIEWSFFCRVVSERKKYELR